MIRTQQEYAVVARRVKYLEAQLAVLVHDVAPTPANMTDRAHLRREIDEAKRALAGFVAGIGDQRG